jgi:tetratricopeptide (TPR) repeat protein
MTRKMVLTWLLPSLLVPVVIVGALFAFRDSTVDRLRFLLMARTVGMTKQQADQLEGNVKADPKSFADRMELLYFYSFKKSSPDGLSPDELANRRQHILWVIANKPSSGFAGDPAMEFYPKNEELDTEGVAEARKLWLVQVQTKPSDARRMYNAGEFFSSIHDYPQSEMLFERSRTIDPAAYDVTFSLATDYWHDTRYSALSAERVTNAKKALGMFEQALKNAHGKQERRFVLPDAAQAALESGDDEKATSWSKEMLSMADQSTKGEDFTDEIHYGNIVLGRIALQHGDIAAAGSYLAKAGLADGNPHLDTFGPNMMLAKELLQKGDDKPVLAYLVSCGRFWKDDDGKLAKWRSDVTEGKMPDFGPNLNY